MEESSGATPTPSREEELVERAVAALERIATALEDAHVVMAQIAGIPHNGNRHEHWDEGQTPEDRAAGIAAAKALEAEGGSGA